MVKEWETYLNLTFGNFCTPKARASCIYYFSMMQEEKLNPEYVSFADYVIDEAFGAHELDLANKDLDRMFFHCVSSDEFEESLSRQTMTETYLCLKKMIVGLKKGFETPIVFKVYDPFD